MKRPFLLPAVMLVAGIFAGRICSIPTSIAYGASALLLICAFVFVRKRVASLAALLLAVFSLGSFLYQSAITLPDNHIAHLVSRTPDHVTLAGTIVNDPLISDALYGRTQERFIVDARAIKTGDRPWRPVGGRVMVNVYREMEKGGGSQSQRTNYGYGDTVILDGTIARPRVLKNPVPFDYAAYLAAKGIYAVMTVSSDAAVTGTGVHGGNVFVRSAYAIRHAMNGIFDRFLDGAPRDFLKALFIGQRSGIDASVQDDFIKTGTVHILSISGQHVAFLSALLLFICMVIGVPRKPALVLTAIATVFYAVIAGSSPPIIRSAIVFILFAIGYLIDRDSDMLNALALAALLILVNDPRALFDPSFQLSFASIASIIVLAPRIYARFLSADGERRSLTMRIRLFFVQSVAVSAAAWIGVAPIVAYYFNITSPVAIIANLVVLPIIFGIMAVGVLLVVSGAMMPLVASLCAAMIAVLTKTLFWANHMLAAVPMAYVRMPAPSGAAIILYYLALGIIFLPKEFVYRRLVIRKAHGIIFLLALVTVFVWATIPLYRQPVITTVFFDVGQGDGAVVHLPDNRVIVIDGGNGSRAGKLDAGRAIIAPYLWNRGIQTIDAIVVSHPHEDHLGGILYLLDNFKVRYVIDNGARPRDVRIARRYEMQLRRPGVRHLRVRAGQEIQGFKDVRLYIFHPPQGALRDDPNNDSLVLQLVYKKTSILFCGDSTAPAMEQIMACGADVVSTIIKIPHHGSGLGNATAVQCFFAAARPMFGIISCAKEIAPVGDFPVYTTYHDGALVVTIDGETAKVDKISKS